MQHKRLNVQRNIQLYYMTPSGISPGEIECLSSRIFHEEALQARFITVRRNRAVRLFSAVSVAFSTSRVESRLQK